MSGFAPSPALQEYARSLELLKRANKARKARKYAKAIYLIFKANRHANNYQRLTGFKKYTSWFSRLGYVGVAVCGAPQWIQTLITGKAEGLSVVFVAALALALIFLQIGFQRDRLGWAYKLGNAAALFNALAMAAAWAWV